MSAARTDEGQAVIFVGLSIVVLLAAVALGVDWGFGLTQRRVAQNAADSAAIAAARALATSTILVNDQIAFRLSEEGVYCVAQGYAQDNRTAFAPTNATTSLSVQIGNTSGAWTDVTSSTCPSGGTGTAVPADTIYVRVVAGTTYRSLLASIAGQPVITAQASARAQIAGGTPGAFPVWPMVRHYSKDDFNAPCGSPCDPASIAPTVFWTSTGSLDNMVYGQFKGLVDYSRYSTRYTKGPSVAQLMDGWDMTGSAQAKTPLKDDASGDSKDCDPKWDTAGDQNPSTNDKKCDIPNWAYYAFGGSLSLTADWSKVSGGREKPSPIGDRTSGACKPPLPDGLVAPSCGAGKSAQGDWIETAFGDIGTNISPQLLAYIQAHGRNVPGVSDQTVPGGKVKYGKAVVIGVYLWDCAETFNDSKQSWDLVSKGPDCSTIKDGSGLPTIDRVHLFTAAPFTFYEGLVSSQEIKGFWGGGFADPTSCSSDPSTCPAPNAFYNTAFLVPDE